MRHFHSYGPVEPSAHFCVPRTELVEGCVGQLVGDAGEGGHYFAIWAPRQTGKTWLMRRAIEEIRKRCGEQFLVGALSMQGVILTDDEPDTAFLKHVPDRFDVGLGIDVPAPPDWEAWTRLFRRGVGPFDRPLILLIDEFDSLPAKVIDRLVTLFRDIYLNRGAYVLHGLALIGVRAVLGVDNPRGSPFNIQRSLHVPGLTTEEVARMFRDYQEESGQPVADEVVKEVYAVTRGQPGLVGWLGELLTEKYNRDPRAPVTREQWDYVYRAASQVEPNNTILNLLKKARHPAHREHVIELFKKSDIPFRINEEWCNYLYLNGILDHEDVATPDGVIDVCRFSCPFVQLCLYHAFSREMEELGKQVPIVDPRDDLTEVFARLDLPALLERYRDFLRRLKAKGINPWRGQPRRADLHLTEAVGHFHLYWWLVEAARRHLSVSPEFPTGNGKVDLHVRSRDRAGVIEVKSFTQRSDLPDQRRQAARYAKSRGLPAATLALFVPTEDEDLVAELSSPEDVEVEGIRVGVTTVAIAAA